MEYQYYDFRAIDRALAKSEMAALRAISTRAVITSTSFTNHYEWGDLKADPLELLERYFDAFLYVANWGDREFYLRLPLELADHEAFKAMRLGDAAHVRKAGNHLIVGFSAEVELDDYDDGTGWMGSLAALRSDLLLGDHRCLYLGWLLCAQYEEFAEDDMEPFVPPGLDELSAPLRSLIEFLGIDEDLVEVAALASSPFSTNRSRKKLDSWIRSLPEKEKDDLLVSAVSDPGERWKVDLLRRVERQTARTSSESAKVPRRTVADLLEAARSRAEERSRRLDAQRAKEAARRKAKEEAERVQYLDQLAKREAETWNKVAAHILKRQPSQYEIAVALLTDLRDLATRQGRTPEFRATLESLRRRHAAKASFLRRLAKANL